MDSGVGESEVIVASCPTMLSWEGEQDSVMSVCTTFGGDAGSFACF